jgi:hypothetical protein
MAARLTKNTVAEEPERSEGVSKDGRKSEPAAMVRDGALRAPPHHEAELC